MTKNWYALWPMKNLVNRLRERQVARIEKRVAGLNVLLAGLDEDVWPEDYRAAEELRARLWIRRSDIIKKLPPVYEGAQQ